MDGAGDGDSLSGCVLQQPPLIPCLEELLIRGEGKAGHRGELLAVLGKQEEGFFLHGDDEVVVDLGQLPAEEREKGLGMPAHRGIDHPAARVAGEERRCTVRALPHGYRDPLATEGADDC